MEFIPFSDILDEITQDENTRFMTVKEVAYIMGRDKQTVYSYLHGDTQPNWDSAVKLANHIRIKHSYHKLSMQTMLSCSSGRANGRVEDDLMEMHEACTDFHRFFDDERYSDCDNVIAKMKSEVKDLEAEIRKARGNS